MYSKILLMTAVLLSGQLYAQSTPTTKPVGNVAPATVPQQILTYLKEKFSASYHGEYYFVRRDVESKNPDEHKIQDLQYMHNPTVIYKPTNNWQVLATAEFKYTDLPGGGGSDATFVNGYYRSLLNLTRKNILVEKEVGIQLDAGIGRRDFNTGLTGLWGNDRAFTTISKTYGLNTGSLFVQYLYNDPKQSTPTTWKHGLELIPTISIQLTPKLSYLFNDDFNYFTPTGKTNAIGHTMSHDMNLAYLNYQWTDKINTYYQFKYEHSETFTDSPRIDYFLHYAGIGYAFTPKITIAGEVGSEIFNHGDKKFFSNKASYPELAVYFDAAL